MTQADVRSRLTTAARSRLALEGLSIGDAFGERFFVSPAVVESLLASRAVPAPPWRWTDDTAMGISVHEVLVSHGQIDRDELAARFAARYRADPLRGYGGMAHRILQDIGAGAPWKEAAGQAFGGQGSRGNGSAMRVAPVGGYFAEDLEKVAVHAKASAEPTHAHPDGQAGAVAVAVGAALAWQMGSGVRERSVDGFFREVIVRTPTGPTRDGIERAASLSSGVEPRAAATALGSGSEVTCADTVPFSLWCAARHLDDFEEALWTTVCGLGDRDTTCAIVGGIVALYVGPAGIPTAFASAREPLDLALDGEEDKGAF